MTDEKNQVKKDFNLIYACYLAGRCGVSADVMGSSVDIKDETRKLAAAVAYTIGLVQCRSHDSHAVASQQDILMAVTNKLCSRVAGTDESGELLFEKLVEPEEEL